MNGTELLEPDWMTVTNKTLPIEGRLNDAGGKSFTTPGLRSTEKQQSVSSQMTEPETQRFTVVPMVPRELLNLRWSQGARIFPGLIREHEKSLAQYTVIYVHRN